MDMVVNGNVVNQANTLVDAGDDTDLTDSPEGPMGDGGDDILVEAYNGAEAFIEADAWNYLWDGTEVQQATTLNVTVNGSVDNTANVSATTGDEVWVTANYDNDGRYPEAGIEA